MSWIDGFIKRIIIVTAIILIALWIWDKICKLNWKIYWWFQRKIEAERERNFPLTDEQLREEYVSKSLDELALGNDYDESFNLYKYNRIHRPELTKERI